MHIGLLEDEPSIAEHVRQILAHAGHTVTVFDDGADMIRAIRHNTFDLYVLDWRVPGVSGLDVLRHIRLVCGPHEPVLFLSNRTDEQGIAEVLNAGADDYCIKPVRPQEFIARIQAIVRRAYQAADTSPSVQTLLDYTFDKFDGSVRFKEQTVALSEKEFKLALFFFENADRALSRERLMQEVWGSTGDTLSRTLDVHVSWLRKKLDLSATAKGPRLKPIYGYGYRLMTPEAGTDA